MFEEIINYIKEFFGIRRYVIPNNERPPSSYNTDNEPPQYKPPQYKPPSGPLSKIQEETDGRKKRSPKKKRSLKKKRS
jgi:hypothetical protein